MKAAQAPEIAHSQPRVGASVLLADEGGRVLLTLRRFPPEAECWSLIGGKMDFLETVEDCPVREALRRSCIDHCDRPLTLHYRSSAAGARPALGFSRLSGTNIGWRSAKLRAGEGSTGALVPDGRTSWQPYDDGEECNRSLPALRSYFANQLTSRVLLSISCANRIPGNFTSPVN